MPGSFNPQPRFSTFAYVRLRDQVDRWIDLATQTSDLKLEHRASGKLAKQA